MKQLTLIIVRSYFFLILFLDIHFPETLNLTTFFWTKTVTWSYQILAFVSLLIVQIYQQSMRISPWTMRIWQNLWILMDVLLIRAALEAPVSSFSIGRWTEESWYVNIFLQYSSFNACILKVHSNWIGKVSLSLSDHFFWTMPSFSCC